MQSDCSQNNSFMLKILENDQTLEFYFGADEDRKKVAELVQLTKSPNKAHKTWALQQLRELCLNNPANTRQAVAATPVANAVTDNMRQLSGLASGTRRLRSHHGTYLRSYDKGLKVDMKTGAPGTWENWWVEDRKGKVVFKSIHAPGIFLSALKNNQVTLDYHVNASEFWTPKRNDNGSWSFQSCYGTWLCGHTDGRACLQPHRQAWEEFWLEWW